MADCCMGYICNVLITIINNRCNLLLHRNEWYLWMRSKCDYNTIANIATIIDGSEIFGCDDILKAFQSSWDIAPVGHFMVMLIMNNKVSLIKLSNGCVLCCSIRNNPSTAHPTQLTLEPTIIPTYNPTNDPTPKHIFDMTMEPIIAASAGDTDEIQRCRSLFFVYHWYWLHAWF